jgi:hypothetical protein
MTQYTRKEITAAILRVARDANYQLEYIQLIQLTAAILDTHPFTVYSAIGSLNTVKRIANGSHPATLENS